MAKVLLTTIVANKAGRNLRNDDLVVKATPL